VPVQAEFVSAWAKINLTLSVLGKRDDGYHALASVMQTISLADTLLLRPADDGEITCTADIPALQNEQNLALRAARLLQAEGYLKGGMAIELRKEIPSPGGLGGGSSDAAAVLTAVDLIYGLRLGATRLEELGARLGSDVPFFIHGGAALVEGRGEFVTELPDCPPLWLIIARPNIGIATADVFRRLSPADYGDSGDTDAVVQAIRNGAPLPFERLSNTLEPVVMRDWPAIADARESLLQAGAPVVRMSGSGPTLFAPFTHLAAAAAVYADLQTASLQTWLCHTVPRAQR